MRRLPLLIAIATLLSCTQTPISNPESVKPTLETGPGSQEPATITPETPAKELLPEPWVFEQQFEGRLEHWVRGARSVKLEERTLAVCPDGVSACKKSQLLSEGTIDATGQFRVPLPETTVTGKLGQRSWYCSDTKGREQQTLFATAKSFELGMYIGFSAYASGVQTGYIRDHFAWVSDMKYPDLGNEVSLIYVDQDVQVHGYCDYLSQTAVNLNLKKGWNLTKKTAGSINGKYESHWFTPSRSEIHWYYNPSTIHLKVSSPAKTLRIGETMSNVSLKLVDTDPVPDVPNIQQFSLKDIGSGNWEYSQSTLKAKRIGSFSPEISSQIDGIQYDFRADSDNSIFMHGIEAFGGTVNTGDPSTAKTIVRFMGRDEQRSDIIFKAGDQVEITFPDATKSSSILESTSNFQQLILPKRVMVGLYKISVNGLFNYEFKINGNPSKGFEKSVFVFSTEQPEIMIENRSGYNCSSDSFRISLTDLTNNQVQFLYPAFIRPAELTSLTDGSKFNACWITTNSVKYTKPHRYRFDIIRYETSWNEQYTTDLNANLIRYEFGTE
jgi:hypothetical protein